MPIEIERQVIQSGYDRKTCWVHPRPGIIPGPHPDAVITLNKLRISGMDVFNPLADMKSNDGGQTWNAPVEHCEIFGRHDLGQGKSEGISDFWPMWHQKTGVMLGTGHTVVYGPEGDLLSPPPRHSAYSVYSAASGEWQPWRILELPETVPFRLMEGAGSTQRFDLPDGDVLLPSYYTVDGTSYGVDGGQFASVVLRCRFDGETLSYVAHGYSLTTEQGSGFCEPSLAYFGGRFYMTLRNDEYGAVATGDGLNFGPARRWTFDDGSDLGNYRTQQHWVTMRDALYLVYTRRGANNDHILWNRAPLFMAQVDTERLCLIRETEQVLVPERGARLCNFGVAQLNENESWVTVAEWMQTTEPDHHDCTVCERYGSDNSIYLVKVRTT